MNQNEQTPSNTELCNQAITDALKVIIEALEELKRRLCELPPGCE